MREGAPAGGFRSRLWVLYRLHGNPSRCLIKLSPCPPPRHSIPPSLRGPPAPSPPLPPPPAMLILRPPKRASERTPAKQDTKRWSLPQTFARRLADPPPTNPLAARTRVHLRAPHSRPPRQEGRQETFNSLFREMKNSRAPRERRPMTFHGLLAAIVPWNGDESESSFSSLGIFRSRGTASSLVIKGRCPACFLSSKRAFF